MPVAPDRLKHFKVSRSHKFFPDVFLFLSQGQRYCCACARARCLLQPGAGLLAIALGSDVAEQGAVKQNGNRDSDKATGWATRGSNPGWGKKFTLSSLLFRRYWSSFSGVKLPER